MKSSHVPVTTNQKFKANNFSLAGYSRLQYLSLLKGPHSKPSPMAKRYPSLVLQIVGTVE